MVAMAAVGGRCGGVLCPGGFLHFCVAGDKASGFFTHGVSPAGGGVGPFTSAAASLTDDGEGVALPPPLAASLSARETTMRGYVFNFLVERWKDFASLGV